MRLSCADRLSIGCYLTPIRHQHAIDREIECSTKRLRKLLPRIRRHVPERIHSSAAEWAFNCGAAGQIFENVGAPDGVLCHKRRGLFKETCKCAPTSADEMVKNANAFNDSRTASQSAGFCFIPATQDATIELS